LANLDEFEDREPHRLAALACYDVMDSPRERSFDELAALTAKLCDTPIAVVNLVGDGRQFFKAEVGLGVRETPLESSFCVKALLEDDLLVVPDLTKDRRFDCNPLVTGDPHIRAYAGALLKTEDGLAIGTLCVLDHRTREFTELQQETLRVLARQVMAQLDLRRTVADRDRRYDELQVSREQLTHSDARYRTLFDSIESGFCIVEVDLGDAAAPIDYRVIEANPAFYRQTGFVEAIRGRWLRDAVPDLEEHFYDIYGRVARTGEPARFEEGSAALGRWFDVYAFRFGDATEHRVAILFNDISARRTAEEALRDLNETLEDQVEKRTAERDRMWDTSPDLMLVIDFDGVFRRVNPAWTTVLGYEPDELVGRHVNEFVLPDDYRDTVDAYQAAKAGERPHVQNRYRHRDGSFRWIAWVAAPAGDLTYATGRDITAEKAREAELAHTQDQLRQAQKMEAVGQLTGGLAHDFNNLLTGMMGNLELLQMRVARGRLDDLDRFVLAAQGAGRRAASLTQRLLAFSRRQTLDPKPTEVNRLIAGMEDLLRRTVGPAIDIEVVGAGGLWPACIDAGQLENALLNLTINARDAMPDGGRLTIETANKWLDDRSGRERDLPPGQYLSICVTDTGTGMSAETVERAFEPFFTTKPLGEGTGLGLSMIYGFARQSEGQVRVYSELGIGTTICIYLPRHHGDAGLPDQDVAIATATTVGRGTVLVVDDEATIRHLIDEVLGEAGYTVIGAGDGAAGIKMLQAGTQVELLITDVGLPNGMNGREVADAARSLRPGLKVLFITGYAENAAVGNGHLEPGMELLTKPFTLEALTAKVAGMMKDAARSS
jgi:PAS domain S-box-containing protein